MEEEKKKRTDPNHPYNCCTRARDIAGLEKEDEEEEEEEEDEVGEEEDESRIFICHL